jgi:phenylacetic acid degradation operon negative regulatory protein
LAIGPAGARPAAERADFRGAAQHARLVEMRPGVWCRPDNLPPAATPTEVWSVVVGSATVWTATPPANAVPDLVARFRLDDWAVRARELIDGLARSTQPLSTTTDAIPPAFAAGAAALQHLRRDPILPVALLPVDWPGDALRAAYRAYQPAFGAAVAAFFAS